MDTKPIAQETTHEGDMSGNGRYPVRLDGKNPLWNDLRTYVRFVQRHADEINDRYLQSDENAEMIVKGLVHLGETPAYMITDKWRSAYAVVVERYISQHHPHIAVIAK